MIKFCKNCEILKEQIISVTERLYEINATISGRFCSGLCKISQDEIMVLNKSLGNVIKDLRRISEDAK